MDSPIDVFREAEKIASEHYDDEGTFWFTTKSGKRIGVKKGQTLEDALNQSGIPKDDVDQSDVTGADLAKNEQEDTKDDDSLLQDMNEIIDSEAGQLFEDDLDNYDITPEQLQKYVDNGKLEKHELPHGDIYYTKAGGRFGLGSDVSNFVKETGTSVEDVRDGDHMGNDIGKTLEMEDGSEYVVYDNYDDAEQAVKENIRQQLEDEPELFNQSFIESHQTISETNARLFGNDFGDMMVEDRDLDELKEMADDYGIEYDEDVDDDKLKDELSYARSKEVTETILRDGLRSFLVDDEGIVSDDEFQEQYGKWLHLDIDSAVDDALDSDGLGHFLSSYDGDYKELKDGKIIARIN